MKFNFIASGITFDTDIDKKEVEYYVQQAINEQIGGYARFYYEKINDNKIQLIYIRDAIYDFGNSEYIYDTDMSLITGICINGFQIKPVGNPIIYPIKFSGKNFYSPTASFLRLYKYMLFREEQQVEDIRARIYSDRVIIEIIF